MYELQFIDEQYIFTRGTTRIFDWEPASSLGPRLGIDPGIIRVCYILNAKVRNDGKFCYFSVPPNLEYKRPVSNIRPEDLIARAKVARRKQVENDIARSGHVPDKPGVAPDYICWHAGGHH